MAKEVMITTEDNPFDPFDESDKWNNFDQVHGYNTLALIARLCRVSDEESDAEQKQAWEDAIEDVLKYANAYNYKKIEREIK